MRFKTAFIFRGLTKVKKNHTIKKIGENDENYFYTPW